MLPRAREQLLIQLRIQWELKCTLCGHAGTDMDLTNPPHPHECRFQLHTPHQFVASKALRKARKTLGTSKEDIQALETASDSERQRNEAEFKLRSGQQAIFGSVVQMYSPTSNSFLQAEKTIAREENTALECSVGSSKYRAKTPWFRIMPGAYQTYHPFDSPELFIPASVHQLPIRMACFV